ncbi:glycosyltransferase family 4 protein [Calothrix sp. PCC 7507]|uniref:glycosyltransferase family 4 protein n=1 Tax=Calothrix sp. PCC 7507 TaxID=99598 RepID=UPI00029EE178|nr:glycosyltransferase family 4 protein [Calothrix sp. PCC 7507]AFY32497.1 glycosyl transferase group 1 [Calothrix sp. PCC 7507]
MRKLLILPGNCDTLGGALVSLSMLIAGVQKLRMQEHLCVLVQADSAMEKYLQKSGQDFCLQPIHAPSQTELFQRALQWVNQQPKNYPLLLDSCAYNYLLPTLLTKAPKLRLSGRPIYYFCHDLVASNHFLGYLARKFIFFCLSPRSICNSYFTARHVRDLMPNIQGVLYQSVDKERFNESPLLTPPKELQAILQYGFRIMLTPSRLNTIYNSKNGDKNLRALIPVLAKLKVMGYNYHGVVIGEDKSPNQINSSFLLKLAEEYGVSDRFTILPPTLAIEDYYKCADVVVTLAPQEAFGRVVVEAIACGVPVIGSRTGGIGEILNHFAPAWTVDSEDIQAAATAIIKVANDPNTSKLLEQGKNWVQSECNITNYAQRMLEITGISVSAIKPTASIT